MLLDLQIRSGSRILSFNCPPKCTHIIRIASVGRGHITSNEEVLRAEFKLMELLSEISQRIFLGSLVN